MMTTANVKGARPTNEQNLDWLSNFAHLCNCQAILAQEPIYVRYDSDMEYIMNKYGHQIKATRIG